MNVLKIQIHRLQSLRKTRCFQAFIPLLFTLQFLPVKTLAAPFPGMGSSKLTSNQGILHLPQKGFQISVAQTNWKLLPLETETKQEVGFRFYDEKTKATLSLKSDTLTQPTTLEAYSKKWIREYASFGFDFLGSKPFLQNESKALVIDLFHKKLQKQTRQVIFLKDKTSVILTCTHDVQNFQKILPECNSIIRTFRWASLNHQ